MILENHLDCVKKCLKKGIKLPNNSLTREGYGILPFFGIFNSIIENIKRIERIEYNEMHDFVEKIQEMLKQEKEKR